MGAYVFVGHFGSQSDLREPKPPSEATIPCGATLGINQIFAAQGVDDRCAHN